MENTNLKDTIEVGHVVLADYLDFKGTIHAGMFLIIGIETHRDFAQYEAIKISSSKGSFQVLIESRYLNCLHYDSYVNCTDIQKISSEQCKTVLGRLNSQFMNIVKRQVQSAMNRFYSQMDDFIDKDYKYTESYWDNPNRIKLGKNNTLIIDGKAVSIEGILKAIQQGS